MAKPPYPEKAVQSQCEELLDFNRWTWFHPKTGLTVKGAFLTLYTGHKGFPDIVAIKASDHRILFIECKGRDKNGRLGKLSPEQVEWRDEIEQVGIEYYLVGPDDVEGMTDVLA